MGGDSPLILFLIVKLLELIGYLCSIICLPITLYCKIVIFICDMQDDIKRSRQVHFLMSLPRMLIVIPFFPWSFIGLSYLYGWLVSLAIHDHAKFLPYVLAIVALVINIVGFLFTRYKFESMKEFKLGKYFKSLGESIVDLGALVATVVSIGTVVRIPFMLNTFGRKKNVRKQMYLNMLLILPDLLCVPLIVLQCIFVWRIINLRSKIIKDKVKIVFSFKARILCIFEGIKILWDLVVIAFSPLLLIFPYHLVKAIREINASKNHSSIDDHIFTLGLYELMALFDFITFTLFTIVVVCTVYRLYHAIIKIKEEHGYANRRFQVYAQILYVLIDVVVLFCGFFVLVSVFRMYRAVVNMRTEGWHRYQKIVLLQFLKLLKDIPFILMGLFVTVLLWRAFFMIRDVFATPSKSKRRRVVARHFGLLFVDILDTPFILASLLILATGWRTYFFVRGFPRGENARNKQRAYVFKQFIAWVLDIPTAIGLLLLIITIYRAKTTISQLTRYFKVRKASYNKSVNSDVVPTTNSINSVPPPISTTSVDDEDNPAPRTTYSVAPADRDIADATSWRMIVGKQFFLLIIDIPFPILLLLTVWRLPILVKRLKEIDDPERSYLQRRLLILRYLWYVLLDIICFVPLVVIFLTVWRVPSFVAMVKKYQRGDNEHKEIGLILIKLIIDIPFVLIGLLTFVFPWRGIFLIKAVYKDCKTDQKARIMAMKYLAAVLVDLFNMILTAIIIATIWRLPTFIYALRYYLKPELNVDKTRWFHLNAITKSTIGATTLIGMDILFVIQLLCTLLIGFEVRPLFRVLGKIKQGDHKFGIEDCRHPVSFFFLETLRDIPHIVLLPIKAIGLLFYPIHLYLGRRTKSKTTQSFLKFILLWIHDLSMNVMTFYEFDKFATINLFGALIIIPNELGCLIVGINAIYMFIVTLGSPLWNKIRIKYEWNELGNAIGPFVIVEYITVALQTILFPVFIAMQILMLILPIILGLACYNPTSLSFTEYWELFFKSGSFWRDNIAKFHAGLWAGQAFWVLVMAVAWHINYLVARKYFPLFSPWKSYYWLVKKVFVGRMWGLYKLLLSKPTHVCYRLRRVCLVGELLMFPLFLIWTCWPLIIPIVTRIYYIFIASGLVTVFLIFKSYFIIREAWGEVVPKDETPKVTLTGVFVRLPEDGGLVITYSGRKPHGFVINDARLALEGDAIWKAIEKSIGKTKLRAALMIAGYPITLCPMFFDVAQVNNAQDYNNFEFSILIGVAGSKMLLKKKVLVRTLQSIIAVDDPTFDFTVEYGSKDFGWKKQGVLCKFNTSLSIILQAGNDNEGDHQLAIKVDESMINNHLIPSPPPNPLSKPSTPSPPPSSFHATSSNIGHQQHPQTRYNTHNNHGLDQSYDADLQLAIELSRQEEFERQKRFNPRDSMEFKKDGSRNKAVFYDENGDEEEIYDPKDFEKDKEESDKDESDKEVKVEIHPDADDNNNNSMDQKGSEEEEHNNQTVAKSISRSSSSSSNRSFGKPEKEDEEPKEWEQKEEI